MRSWWNRRCSSQSLFLLVVGTSLGDEGPHVPDTFLENNVVLVLRNNGRGKKRYGYSDRPYDPNEPASWEGNWDELAAQAAAAVVRALLCLGCRKNLGVLGISAGCHKVMAVLTQVAEYMREEPYILRSYACGAHRRRVPRENVPVRAACPRGRCRRHRAPP